jgi:hypothetical protein
LRGAVDQCSLGEYRRYFTPPDAIDDLEDIPRIFSKYGPNTRLCVLLAGDNERETAWLDGIQRALLALGTVTWALVPAMDTTTMSHHLFGIQPSPNRIVARPYPLTRFITSLIADRAETLGLERTKRMFETLYGNSITRTAAGRLFENLVHARLRRGATLSISQLDGSKSPLLNRSLEVDPTPPRIQPVLHSFLTTDQLGDLLIENEGQLFTPFQPNYPSIDSILRHNDRIWLLQVTLAKSHAILVSGLERVWQSIPAEYLPTTVRKAILVVITLTEDEDYKSAKLVAKTEEEKKRLDWWEDRLEKYFVAVPKDWLFQ